MKSLNRTKKSFDSKRILRPTDLFLPPKSAFQEIEDAFFLPLQGFFLGVEGSFFCLGRGERSGALRGPHSASECFLGTHNKDSARHSLSDFPGNILQRMLMSELDSLCGRRALRRVRISYAAQTSRRTCGRSRKYNISI